MEDARLVDGYPLFGWHDEVRQLIGPFDHLLRQPESDDVLSTAIEMGWRIQTALVALAAQAKQASDHMIRICFVLAQRQMAQAQVLWQQWKQLVGEQALVQ